MEKQLKWKKEKIMTYTDKQRKMLEDTLHKKRTQMVRIGLDKGFTHPDTIHLSQEVDKLVNKFTCEQARKCAFIDI